MQNVKADPTDLVEWVQTKLMYNYKSDTVHWRTIYSDDKLGAQLTHYPHTSGYRLACGILKRNRYVHHIVWILVKGCMPEFEIDHIDRDKANNAHWNLRDVTKTVNQNNRKAKGYYWHKKDKKWQANISIAYTTKYLGQFNTEAEAKAAYDAAKLALGFTQTNVKEPQNVSLPQFNL